jgi:hypothetical protein
VPFPCQRDRLCLAEDFELEKPEDRGFSSVRVKISRLARRTRS